MSAAAPRDSRDLVPVQIQSTWLALAAPDVREVLGARPWVPLPGATALVPGVVSWRGAAVALVDLGALTGFGGALGPREVRRRTVVMQSGGHSFALPVDAVREVVEVPRDALRPCHLSSSPFAALEVEISGVPMPIIEVPAVLQALAATLEATP